MICLRKGSLVGAAIVFSTAFSACYDKDDYVLGPEQVRGALELRLPDGGPQSVAADGFSRMTILATVKNADLGQRTIVFSTTAGLLISTSSGGATSEVSANPDGVATIELQSPTTPQQIRVRAHIKGKPEFVEEISFGATEADPATVIRFVATPPSPPADGATLTRFVVMIAPGIPAERRAVTFRSSEGDFAGSGAKTETVTPDASNEAVVYLRSTTSVTSGRVSATVAGFTQDIPVDFTRAYPDTILVDAGAFQLEAGTSEVSVRATLVRDRGTVTRGSAGSFTAVDSLGSRVGNFRSVGLSDANGLITGIYSAGQTSYRGPVTITVGITGSPKRGSARIDIVDPPAS